jgi:hypothetical protein
MGETPSKFNQKNMAATIKKGALVRVVTGNLENSLEALASYMFNSTAEVLDVKDDYALIKFYVPTPSVWLKLEQLEPA